MVSQFAARIARTKPIPILPEKLSLLSHFPNLLRVKTISSEVPESERSLKRVLGPVDLTMLGMGAIVVRASLPPSARRRWQRDAAGSRPSTGGFFHPYAITCSFAALCYAELASLAHLSGGAYSYAYATLGEWWRRSSAGTWSWNTRSAT